VWTLVLVSVHSVSERLLTGDGIVRLCSVDGGYSVST